MQKIFIKWKKHPLVFYAMWCFNCKQYYFSLIPTAADQLKSFPAILQ